VKLSNILYTVGWVNILSTLNILYALNKIYILNIPSRS
jgi:hypothetical protein